MLHKRLSHFPTQIFLKFQFIWEMTFKREKKFHPFFLVSCSLDGNYVAVFSKKKKTAKEVRSVLIVFNLCKACLELVNAFFLFLRSLFQYCTLKLLFLTLQIEFFSHAPLSLSLSLDILNWVLHILLGFMFSYRNHATAPKLEASPDWVEKFLSSWALKFKEGTLKNFMENNLWRKFESKLCKVFIIGGEISEW